MGNDPIEKAQELEKQAAKLRVEATELQQLAKWAKQGKGPRYWDKKAKDLEAAARKRKDIAERQNRKAGAYDTKKRPKHAAQQRRFAKANTNKADALKKKAQEARKIAKAMRDNDVPDDDPKTGRNETYQAGGRLEQHASDARKKASALEKEARVLRRSAK